MIDVVTANEFTFTPSAFIAAYIEQEEKTVVTEDNENGGQLDTTPKTSASLTGSATTEYVANVGTVAVTSPLPTEVSRSGILAVGPGSPVTASGSLTELLGQQVIDTRTSTKTTTTTTGVTGTVVLVLSYGQFKAKCANAQATVSSIYTQVAAYLNALV